MSDRKNEFTHALSVDIGGTFTDFSLLDLRTGEVTVHKVLTDPEDPARTVMRGAAEALASAGSGLDRLSVVVHSTTLTTNAIIQHKGARTALITTKGFRDILEMGREQMYDIFDLKAQFPPPLVPRYLRREVSERTSRDGEVFQACDQAEALAIVEDLVTQEGVEAVAISLLHSYKNPSNEHALKQIIGDRFPELVLSLSSEVAPVINEYERGVIFRLGRLLEKPKGPGIQLVFAPIDRMVRVSLRTIAHDVPPQDVITKDNVSVKVNAVIYYRVLDPNKAVVEVEQFHYATSQLAQTTLRSILGQVELDDLLSQREKLNADLQTILDRHTDPWGIKVSMVEVKHVDLPVEMQRAMARQAEAEREKRAKIIHADGEYQAAENLTKAAQLIAREPATLQLRFLQTLTEISAEKNSTILFPIPMDLLKPFLKKE
ncbi:MAG: hydantoinase/oxoprolinase N-terminal domain-containing protein [Dehalococcoidia bacterium]